MIRFAKSILAAAVSGLALSLLPQPAVAAQPATVPASLPLYFEANQGQVPTPAQFIARSHDSQFLISPAEVQIALRKTGAEPAVVRMQFAGANARAQVQGDAELSGKINYLTGNNPAQWRVGLATFAKIQIEELYPGINLVYYGNQKQLEYDFTIAPEADPGAIVIHFDGTDKISVNPQGELILTLAGGEIRQPKPVVYQMVGGARKEIAGGYRLVDAHTVAFSVGQYDHRQALVIDPVLGFSTYFGGTAGDAAWGVAVDNNGFVYLTGQTLSSVFSTGTNFSTPGAFQTQFQGGGLVGDAFVAKFSADGTSLIYLTYLGGSVDDAATCLAVDNNGNAFVAGYTDSPNFPVSTNAVQKTIGGVYRSGYNSYPWNGFVTKLAASGSNIIYSTFLGGNGENYASHIAVDSADNAYITGYTSSANFLTTTNAMFSHLRCTNSLYYNCNSFVTEIASNGSQLVYSSYFGGTNYDIGMGIAVDSSNFVYLTGYTASTNFPTTNAIFQPLVQTNFVGTNQVVITNSFSFNGSLLNGSTNNGTPNFDAFVAKFYPGCTNLVYSTLLGGTNNDVAAGIAVDNNGNAYVTGWTASTNFPNTIGLYSYLADNIGASILVTNTFLTEITNGPGTGASIAWSAMFGGNGVDVGNGVALDPAGNIFVTGSATSTNFPVYNVPGFMFPTNAGMFDAFVFVFTPNATTLLYSGYLGGNNNDYGYGIAVDTNGDAYVVGQTFSPNFPTFNGSYTNLNGTSDAFLTEIILAPTIPVIITQPATNQSMVVYGTATFKVTASGTPPLSYQWLMNGTNLVNGTNRATGVIFSGANTNVLTYNSSQMTNNGNYTNIFLVIITNYAGSVTSSPATLLVTNIAPVITTQPASQTVGVGATVTFSVGGNASAPFFFQWQDNGANLVDGGRISGSTTYALTITNVQPGDAGNYQVIITNYGGLAISSFASLTVYSAPVILTQPTSQAMAVGATATLSVNAVGTVPLSYQWQMNGTNLVNGTNRATGGIFSGATNSVLTFNSAQMTNTGNYTNIFSVTITNSAGATNSFNATLLVTNIPPTITVQPSNQAVGGGSNVTITVTANGTAPLNYQWWFGGTLVTNGGSIAGATTSALTITNVQTTNSGSYSVIVTNFGGSATSSNALLTVYPAPVIIAQPTNQAMAVGSNAAFVVTAVGTLPLSYQWQMNGTNLANGTNRATGGIFSGATSNVLTFNSSQMTNTGNYTNTFSVTVTNSAGATNSSDATLLVTNIPPAITGQPTNQAVVTGSNVTITVTATGSAPVIYQWQVNGTNLVNGGSISGATTNVLKINNAQTTNSGSYSVIVTNYGGSATSSNAFLTVAAAPVIITQPTNQAVVVGQAATFIVSAIGISPLSYQWQVNGTNLVNGGFISGATSNVLTISNTQTNNSATNYAVTVTNSAGSVTSSNVVLTVISLSPTIAVQPSSQAMAVGAAATFAVIATGTPPLYYQWQMNGTNLVNGTNQATGGIFSGATNTVLTFNSAQMTNAGNYTNIFSVTVANYGGAVISSNATLLVTNIPPTITVQPSNQAVGVGSNVTITVTANGSAPLNYQWWFEGTLVTNGTSIGGATTSALTITNAQTTNSGSYSVIVTNFGGSATSSNALLTVYAAPVIITQPTNQAIAVGSNAAFIVSAVGTAPLNYQWQLNGINLTNGASISGATSNVLTISNAQTNNSATNFTVTVTNSAGSVTSSNVALLVTNIPPTITVQPASLAVVVGSNVTMTVTATGTAPLNYQWYVNGTNQMAGATNNVLAINNAQTTNSGGYSVIVTNYGGSVTSVVAVLTVASSPVILALQPTNQSMAVGSTATFAVTAVGVAPLRYQWKVNGTNLANGTNLVTGGIFSGTTNNTLTINNVQTTNSASYTVVVTNTAGATTSSPAILLVTNVPPTIVAQPINQTVVVGSNATFAVTANGPSPLSYQWYWEQAGVTNPVVNGGSISGATINVLTINNAQTNNSGNYWVTVSNLGGLVTSSNAVLTVALPPVILAQPTNQVIAVGSNATFAVTATGGSAPLSYQWQLNGINLVDQTNLDGDIFSGSTSYQLTISNAQTNNSATNYTVIVTNIAGLVTSSNTVLLVAVPPTITVQPTNQTVVVGSNTTFAVTATGTAPLSYQWQVNGTNLVDGPDPVNGDIISGSTNYELTISNAQLNNGSTNYTVIVANYGGSVTSSPAILTVALPEFTRLPLPSFAKIVAAQVAGGGFVLSGGGGASNGTYYVLVSSNLLLPFTNWTCLTTNQFDNNGNFIFTNTTQTNAAQQFYLLQMP